MSFIDSTTTYFRSAKAELEKVSWPSQNDTIRYSTLVVGITLVTAVFFAALDFGLHKTVESLIAKRTAPQTSTNNTVNTAPFIPTPAVEATTPSGAPADVKVETLPVIPQQK